MFRLWGKEFKDNHMLRDTVICDETDDTRTHKIFNALDSICYEFDLSKPIWWILLFRNLNGTAKRVSIRTILWILLILIIWKSRLWKKETEYSASFFLVISYRRQRA